MSTRPWLAFLLLFAIAACKNSPPAARRGPSGPPTVYTVNYPLAYFAERIAGDRVTIVFPAPPGQDPAFWKPSAETVVAYQEADLILLNGAGYAKWTAKVSLPMARLVNCGAPQREEFITTDTATPHTHGPAGGHSHGEFAFTLWLDPGRARRQAEAIHGALVKRWPEHREAFDGNLAALCEDLDTLDADLASALGGIGDDPILFSHPVYQYLQERFGLNGRSLHWEPGEDPGGKGWAELDRLRADHPATLMIWEGEPLPAVVTKLKAMGIRSVVFDPCGNRPGDGDFLDVMRKNVKALRTSATATNSP